MSSRRCLEQELPPNRDVIGTHGAQRAVAPSGGSIWPERRQHGLCRAAAMTALHWIFWASLAGRF